MTPAERQARVDDLERRAVAALASPAASDENKQLAAQHIAQVAELRIAIAELDTAAGDADPMTRAREATKDDQAREAAGLHRLRQGRDQCTAHRRDGQPCQAPAVPDTLVCRRHGGSAPQVLIKARHLELQTALYSAALRYDQAKGTAREASALGDWSRAETALRIYEWKLADLSEMQAERRQQRAAQRQAGDSRP